MKSKKQVNPSPTPQPTIALTTTPFPWMWIGGILLITAMIFSKILGHDFTNWDDTLYVTKNEMMQGSLSAVFSGEVAGNYHPLTMLSLWLNHRMGGQSAFIFLLTNLILHLANVYLVFRLVWTMMNQKIWSAALVALLFAIHPMHIESVAWVAERKDVLYTFFFLLGLLKYIQYIENQRFKTLLFVFLYFILSILSKPAAIIFPGVLLLFDYYYDRPWRGKVLTEKIIFVAVAFIFAIITYSIQSKTATYSITKFSFFDRIMFASYDLMMYVVEAIVPFKLSAIHPFPKGAFPSAYMLAPALCIVVAVGIFFLRKQKNLLFGVGFFFVNLILVLQIITIGLSVMSERYTYVPYIGLFMILAYYLDNEHFNASAKKIIWGITGVWITFLAFTTYNHLDTWRNGETLWTNVLRHYPDDETALYNRGSHYDDAGEAEKALQDYNQLLSINPNEASGLNNRGRLYFNKFKKYQEALNDFDKAIPLTKDKEKLMIMTLNRSYCYYYLGDKPKALEAANKAIQLGAKPKADYMNVIKNSQ